MTLHDSMANYFFLLLFKSTYYIVIIIIVAFYLFIKIILCVEFVREFNQVINNRLVLSIVLIAKRNSS